MADKTQARIRAARRALVANTDDRAEVQADPKSAVVDVLANLMYFCRDRKKLSFADCLRIAVDHFHTETKENLAPRILSEMGGVPTITIRWGRHDQPEVVLPAGFKANLKFVDTDAEGSLLLDYNGVQVYWAVRDDGGDCYIFSEYWCVLQPRESSDSDRAFDLRDLDEIPKAKKAKYRALFPDEAPDAEYKRILAYAIDQQKIVASD